MAAIINVAFGILAFTMVITGIWANIGQIRLYKKLDKQVDNIEAKGKEDSELVYPPGTEL